MTQQPTIPGPDRNTRTPKFRLPPLACDAYTHIFGPGDKYPYAPGRPYTPPDAPLEDFGALHKKLGIGERALFQRGIVEHLAQRGVEGFDHFRRRASSPEEILGRLKDDIGKWSDVIERAGITKQ
jgi:hypothetical protein